jgi:hypothetical protein
MIEEDLITLLTPFCPLSADVAPDKTPPPYVVYSTSRTPGNYLDNGLPLENVRVTIDVHHAARRLARHLAEAIKTVLRGASFGGYVIGDQDLYEPAVKLYRVVIDFEVFVTSTEVLASEELVPVQNMDGSYEPVE